MSVTVMAEIMLLILYVLFIYMLLSFFWSFENSFVILPTFAHMNTGIVDIHVINNAYVSITNLPSKYHFS